METRIYNEKWRYYYVSLFYREIFIIFNFSANPKCYFALDKDSQKFKRSSKGVQHRIKLEYDDYKEVVYSHKKTEVENFNIRVHNGKMSTIKMKKTGLSNVFVKAFIDTDLVSVRPFNKFM